MRFPDGGGIRADCQQFAYGLFFNRMWKVGGYFGERLKDEPAIRHTRMRNNQVGFADYPVAVKQDIKVERARRVGESPDAAAVAFDFVA